MIKMENKIAELNPDFFHECVKDRIEKLEQVLGNKERTIENAPKGKIRIVKHKFSMQYYHRLESSIKNGIYLNRDQDVLAAALAQKDYDRKLVAELKSEIQVLKRLLNSYCPKRIEEIYQSLHENRKPLIAPVMLPNEDYARRWMSFEYEKKAFGNDAPEFYTARGERVRSKSELIIADTLNRFKIPYRYECPIYIRGNGTVHPDFTCLNVRTRKEFYWEHNGMMSNADYADYAIKRIEMYAQSDIIYLGENLVLTFETSSRPLNSRIIECYIQKLLL
jgi:hypothetical protein